MDRCTTPRCAYPGTVTVPGYMLVAQPVPVLGTSMSVHWVTCMVTRDVDPEDPSRYLQVPSVYCQEYYYYYYYY